MKRIYLISNCCISGINFELLCGFAALRENVFNRAIPPCPLFISKCHIFRIDFDFLCAFAPLRENVFNRLIPPYSQLIPKPCISRVEVDLLGAFARKGFSPFPSVSSVPSVASF